MRIAVCDDEAEEREQIARTLRERDPLQRVECFSDGASLLEAARRGRPFSMVFLDIYLPKENGVDIARALRKVSPGTGIVFATTSREHAVDAFSLNALHYLVKPVTAKGVAEAFRRLAQIRERERPVLTVTVGRDSHTVYLDAIIGMESIRHAVEITLADGRVLKVWTPLSELEGMLDERFLKITRGVVVNMDYIEQMGVDVCILRNGDRVPITRSKRTAIRAAYNDYVFARLSQRQGLGQEGDR